MIALHKGTEPVILVTNKAGWTTAYLDAREGGGTVPDAVRYRYRHSEIKAAIVSEAYEKCVYCESKVRHVYPGDTEHILPVSRRPELIVEWLNLAFVCSECNREKLDYYSEDEPLVNPFTDEPDQHLSFFGPMVVHTTPQGLLTLLKLKLDRAPLFERRKERVEALVALIDRWQETPDGELRALLRAEIVVEASPDREYAATTRAFLFQRLGWPELAS